MSCGEARVHTGAARGAPLLGFFDGFVGQRILIKEGGES
jgi:hypothetical protein